MSHRFGILALLGGVRSVLGADDPEESDRDGVLIEGGSLLRSEESALINKAEYRERLAIAIAKGVDQYRRDMAPAG
jgi:hypothetical protein